MLITQIKLQNSKNAFQEVVSKSNTDEDVFIVEIRV